MMRRVLILGAGGHGKVVADALIRAGHTPLGFLDDDPTRHGTHTLGLPVLGHIGDFARHQPDGLILGIGANDARRAIVHALGDPADSLWCNAIHPQAVVAPSARLGRGILVAAGAIINPDARIGDHAIVNTAATIDHDCAVGAYAHLAPGTHLAGNVQIGEGALLGIGTIVIPGRTIGPWSIIGAGSTVIHDLPGHCTALGTPARLTKHHPTPDNHDSPAHN
jgi:acetyltransferase EpsM